MKTKYKDLTIWITGASSGIGQALAVAFAKRGARIILSGRDSDKLEAVKSSCKRANKHIVVPFDISDANQAKEAYDTAKARAGKIDWLINNAGISQRSLIMDTV
ncbi:SDR family NAD(P)-dependent oxidoreductase, partial [Marinobacter sp. 1Y8]